MNKILLIMGILVAAILVVAAVSIFAAGRKRIYGILLLGVSVVIVLGLMIVNKNPQQGPGNNTPSGGTYDTIKNTPTASQETGPSDTAASSTEGNSPIPTESLDPAGVPTAEPTAEPTPTETPENQNGSTIYLTFDDGPSVQATGIILDTLKKYNIKATFFVLDFTDEEIPLLKRMVEEGHSIGIHGYSHEYDKIYTSVDAFMENITKLSDRLENEIGVKPNIIRFPGGSSNTTSIKYCKGIMTELTRLVCEKGYQYFDWNVSPEDAMSKMTPEEISSAVIDGLRSSRKENVVLMHDAEAQKSTALAVEAIVQYGIANGYRFDKLTVDTPPVHHSISN